MSFLRSVRPSNLIILTALPFIIYLFISSGDYQRSLRAILGVENGDLNSAPAGDRTKRKANRGRGLAILQSTPNAGDITLKASAQGLEAVTVNLQSR